MRVSLLAIVCSVHLAGETVAPVATAAGPRRREASPSSSFDMACWSTDDTRVVTAQSCASGEVMEQRVKVWDGVTCTLLFSLRGHTDQVIHAVGLLDARHCQGI